MSYLSDHGINQQSIERFGLIETSDKVIFPVKDKNGKFLFNKIRNLKWSKEAKNAKFFYDPKDVDAAIFNAEAIKNSRYVVITEGEPDAIKLNQEGYIAVTNTSGAATFKDEWIPHFIGKKVYVAYDTDKAGRSGAAHLSKLRNEGIEVYNIELPNLEKGNDICDYFNAGFTAEDFGKLLQDAVKVVLPARRYFHPALTLDRSQQEVLIGIPEFTPDVKNGKYKLNESLKIVSSKAGVWDLKEDEMEKRDMYPISIPSFNRGMKRWSHDLFKRYENEARCDHDDYCDHKDSKGVDPYNDVFLPIKRIIDRYIDFTNPAYSSALALWIMGSYIFPIFEAYPYIHLEGTKGSGKSKILEILFRLSFNALYSSNSSTPSLFRTIENTLSTILLDEGESLTGREVNPDLRLLFNSGYKANGVVTRFNKDSHKTEYFQVYSPKAIASINPLESALKSRCISIVMLRTADKAKGTVRVNDRSSDWEGMRDKLYRFTLEHALKVAEIFDLQEGETELNNRDNELYSPLLAIAKYVDSFIGDEELKIHPVISHLAAESLLEEDPLDDWSLWVIEGLDSLVTDHRPYLIKDIRLAVSHNRILQGEALEDRFSGKWIGGCLRKFGFKRGKATREGKTYLISRKQIEDLKLRYGLNNPSSLSMVNTVTLVTNEAVPAGGSLESVTSGLGKERRS